jgi:CheY-like chemotaxis protein
VQQILVLEDYAPLRRVLATLLRREGYRVVLARTAQETLQALERQANDLLIADMDISTGDGWHVLRTLQSLQNSLPVVALLNPESPRVHKAKALGVRTILRKPVGRQALLTGLKALQPPGQYFGQF